MAKYLMLKHYRGSPAPVNGKPIYEWLELRPFLAATSPVTE